MLDDAERAQVGTMYKQISAFEAKKLGAALLAKNAAQHIQRLFSDKPKSWHPLVYCWRGGKRSGAMAHILREIGWNAETLEGGYKAYRRFVVSELSRLPSTLDFIVIHGPTGSGKSRLLGALRRAARMSSTSKSSPRIAARCSVTCRSVRSRRRRCSRASSSRNSPPSIPRGRFTSKANRKKSASCKCPTP